MSAFYLDHAHIDAIVTAAFQQSPCYVWNSPFTGSVRTETEMGRLLLRENARSLNARYPDDDDACAQDAEEYEHTLRMSDVGRSAVSLIKLCDCYDYQACETDDYYQTVAHRIISHVRSHAVSNLPGYEAAPWTLYDKDATKEQEVCRLF